MDKKQEKALKQLFKGTRLEDYEVDGDTADEVIEYLQERISENEIIYYSKAIAYLQENDQSLRNSLELAAGLGYETANLNSELLATLLLQNNLNEELSGLRADIEAVFDEE